MGKGVTRLLSQLRALVQQLQSAKRNHAKCGVARRTTAYFTARLENINDIFKEISRLHSEILASEGPSSNAYDDEDEYSLADELYVSLKSELLAGLNALTASTTSSPHSPTVPTAPQPNHQVSSNPLPNSHASAAPNINAHNEFRLPTIAVPTFGGDYSSWPSYKNSFEHLIANNQGISNLQRLHYLKNSLTGDARRVIQHYDIIEGNYEAAWAKLKLRYDNKKLLASNYLKTLIHQPGQSKETASHLRSLIDVTMDNLNGLRMLGVATAGWDPIVIHLLIEKLPSETHSLWETSQMTTDAMPTLEALLTFMENRFRALEALSDRPSRTHTNPFESSPRTQPRTPRHAHSHVTSSSNACVLCNGQHYLRSCPSFLRMTAKERLKYVQQHNVCTNCLVPGHAPRVCRNKMNCSKCAKRHHTLLHFDSSSTATESSTSRSNQAPTALNASIITNPSSTRETVSFSHLSTPNSNLVLLATACVQVANATGDLVTLRALVDPGSQVSFVTKRAVQLLQLKTRSTQSKVFGIGETYSGTATHRVTIDLQSILDQRYHLQADFLTIPHITGYLPQESTGSNTWPHIQNLQLADPHYFRNGQIDLLLGAEIYGQIILPGLQKGDIHEPVAQNTTIGWILLGGSSSSNAPHSLSMHSCIEIDSRLRHFWETEEVASTANQVTPDELASEDHFKSTSSRDEDGRMVVRLPFTTSTASLGPSRENAVTRLLQIERKLQRDPQLAADYSDFMKEYESLGHMKVVPENPDAYYIPHHPVFKKSSTTTKVRVVFDASSKTSTGVSLNDCLRVGPTLQADLTSLLTRWRKYPIAFTADLEKMYRQIRIHDQDLDFQRILWRNSPNESIKDYQLQTVTYGTACAQYLAVRSMHQIAYDGAQAYPLASHSMLQDFYVDDLLSGAYDLTEAIELQGQLRKLSASGGFNLRKWATNRDELLQSTPVCDREIKTSLLIDFDDTIKSLGIHWNPNTDDFIFQPTLEPTPKSHTKRSILSEVSKLFDPMGWLGPIIVRAKILMQQIWCLDLKWDDDVPSTIREKWHVIRENLRSVHLISIPRSIAHSKNQAIELHGFSDASIQAYAAVVYSRIVQTDGHHIITLLAAKNKVAPIKQISLPRLELCGAHLLSKLMNRVRSDLQISDIRCYAWCDSSIVLHWLRGHPNRLKTFVANRVSDIIERGNIHSWRHVSGKENPADCATRGLDTVSLQSHPLWWKGPYWLAQDSDSWPTSTPPVPEDLPDVKIVTLLTSVTNNFLDEIINAHSSLTTLTRVFAHIQRFCHNIKHPKARYSGPLSAQELKHSLNRIIRYVQESEFSQDYRALKSKRTLHHRSNLLSLNPFLDDESILRVGGRLQNTTLAFEAKHPIILPKGHHITRLLVQRAHLNTLHGGPELVIAFLRRRFWIINMRSIARQVIYKCIRCFRFNATKCTQLMGNLPQPRVEIDRAFAHTGVDCAGPVDVRMSKGRGAKSYKGYLVLFVCLCTKAVHIEAVSDMSTPAFLAAYRRFCSRRGLPSHIYSDNGTNFVGASRALHRDAGVHHLNVSADLINEIANQGSSWHFIPPSAPHFGGLWEAGIKSIKHHLKRIVGDASLTFEELSTVLSQIEACLNSRPLCPTTSDPSDNSALTPGHFLVGDSLLAPPEVDSPLLNINALTRWQLVQRMRNNFWKRWQREYISRLQQRPKWANKTSNIQKDDLVIIVEDNLPPTRWVLGRIVDTHPGADGLVRVATIKCKNTTIKRPIAKLALLPISQ